MSLPIAAQYLVESLVATTAIISLAKKREPRKVLIVVEVLDVFRFGGVAGSLAALRDAKAPWFLEQVALGDAIAATSALVALVLLVTRSPRARKAVAIANALGLAGILVSQACLRWLGVTGFHGPTLGASFYTALHLLAFHVLTRRRGLVAL